MGRETVILFRRNLENMIDEEIRKEKPDLDLISECTDFLIATTDCSQFIITKEEKMQRISEIINTANA